MRMSIKISETTTSTAVASLLIITILLLPFSVRLSSLAMVFLAAFWLLSANYYDKFQRIRRNWPEIQWPIFYFLILTLSLLYSENKMEGWFLLERRLSLLAFPLILGSVTLTKKQIRLILASFIFSVLIISTIGLLKTYSLFIQNQAQNSSLALDYYQWIFPKLVRFHAPYLAIYLSLAGLISAFWFIRLNNNLRTQILLFGLVVFFSLTLAFTASRTAIAAYSFLIAGLFTHHLIGKKQYLLLLGCIILLFATSFYLLDSLPYLKSKFLSGTGSSERWQLWEAAFIAWKNAPVFGYGIADASKEIESYFLRLNYSISFSHNFDPHNQYISTLLKSGIIGLAAFLLMLFVPAFRDLTKGRLLLPLVMLLFAGCFFTESVLSAQKGVVIFSLLYSLLMLHPLEPSNEKY